MKNKLEFFKVFPCLFSLFADEFESGVAYPLLVAIFVMGKEYFPATTSAWGRDLYLSLIILLPALFQIIGSYLFGDLSDFFGRKKALLICLGGGLFCMILMYWGFIWSSVTLLILSRIFDGLLSGRQPICQAVIADLSTPENKTKNMRFITLTRGIGLILGSIVSALMIKYMGPHINVAIPFYMALTMSTFTFFLVLIGFDETFSVSKKVKLSFLSVVKGLSFIFQDKRIRLLLIASFFLKLGIGIYFNIAAIYLKQDLHNPEWIMGYFYAFIGVGYLLGVLFGLPLLLRMCKLRWAIVITSVTEGILMLMTGIIQANFWGWGAAILVGAADFAGFTILLALVSNDSPPEHQGLVMGGLMAITALAFMFAGAGISLLNSLGSLGLVQVSGIATLMSAILFATYAIKFPLIAEEGNF